jgi:hypothetical protein
VNVVELSKAGRRVSFTTRKGEPRTSVRHSDGSTKTISLSSARDQVADLVSLGWRVERAD